MDQRRQGFRLYIQQGQAQPTSIIGRVLGAIVGIAVFVFAIIAGGVLLLAFLGLAAAFAAVVGVRLWWFKRQMRRTGQQAGQTGPMQSRPADIEGEYSVVDDEQQP